MVKRRKKAGLKFFSDNISKQYQNLTPLIIYFSALLLKLVLYNFIPLSYDEVAYSVTALNIVQNSSWLNIYNSPDLFFFPPLFNWLSAFFVFIGFEQILAVRTVSMLLSSGIPVIIYLMMKENGFSNLRSIFASFLWTVLPGSIYYSVAGQVETAFLFFILLSAYFIQPERRSAGNIIISALCFSAAVWIKETALGFSLVFAVIFLLDKEIRKLMIWGFSAFTFCLPLFIQSFIPNEYDLFFELNNDLINWGMISFVKPFENIAVLAGLFSSDKLLMTIFAVLVIAFILISSVIAYKKSSSSFIVRFSIISNLVFIPFFIIFPKKFEYYLLPVLLFSIILFVISLKEKKEIFILIALVAVFGSYNGLKWRSFIRNYYDETLNFITLVANEKPGATIGTPTPHMAVYIKEKHKLDVKIIPLDFFSGYDPGNCRKEEDRCILRNDYFLSDDEFFAVLFCNKWPVEREKCNIEQMKKVVEKIEKKKKGQIFTLYEVKE
ncbi:MAG TPA: glycosyltransferase family 39 protein [bacterium]|nr:glycosyltransferase family 39 protein [bacterium]